MGPLPLMERRWLPLSLLHTLRHSEEMGSHHIFQGPPPLPPPLPPPPLVLVVLLHPRAAQ
ncbi:hypothetical protein PG994_009817 [Apiospora phragmitis]|uniref:Uncharacterized protein n=1 Tax=Apiospora phragmitis TaxID=2905665 RepID=A0ABR1U759_9PEZI